MVDARVFAQPVVGENLVRFEGNRGRRQLGACASLVVFSGLPVQIAADLTALGDKAGRGCARDTRAVVHLN